MYTVMEFVRVYLGPWSFSGDLLVPSVVHRGFTFWKIPLLLQYDWANLDCSTTEPILIAVLDPIQYVAAVRGLQ